MGWIAIRAYTRKPHQKCEGKTNPHKEPPLRHERVLVFDTETTTDQYQNLKFGSFRIYQSGLLQHEGIFYNPELVDENEREILESYATRENVPLYKLDEFIDEVFYPEIFQLKTLCIGFNLAFDISRLACKAAKARGRNLGGFTFTLSEGRVNPPITIKRIGNVQTFRISSTISNTGKDFFPGYFLDVQTIAEVLLQQKRLSLNRAAEMLNLSLRKRKTERHGEITLSYIEYNRQDVKVTYGVYRKLVQELNRFQIDIPITRIYSEASIGKYALKQLSIKPLSECQPDFPPDILGNIMTAYYGGRTECTIRKSPTKVSVLDFTSMYPTITMLMGLWSYIIADKIEIIDATDEVREIVDATGSARARIAQNWKKYVVLVQVKPESDILPVRMDYKGDNKSFNVGINNLTSDFPMWYALPDVIASKLLTGKSPCILKAIRFVPRGIQKGLKPSVILGIPVDPRKDNLIQVLVEERQRIKKQLKMLSHDDPHYSVLSSREKAMKILVNAMSYGIFIELNPEDKKSEIEVYGLGQFTTKKNHHEKPGTFFHPLLGVMITSGARLFLAMAEAKLRELGAHHAYMDTDSIFVPPEHAYTIIEYFQPLNPYRVSISLLKIDNENVRFYGISSKRYVIYRMENGNTRLVSYKLHGLGHLKNPFSDSVDDWQGEIWFDILKFHYGLTNKEDLEEKYGSVYAISKLTVTTSHVWNRFKSLNKNKPWSKKIKPFNFFLLGFQVVKRGRKRVKPMAPYALNTQAIVHEPFIDYETGEIMQGSQYFKRLSKTISQYIDHPEGKFEGNRGELSRRHVHADAVVTIGKEANDIEDQPLEVEKPQEFADKERWKQRVILMRQSEAERIGINRGTRWRWKKLFTEGKV